MSNATWPDQPHWPHHPDYPYPPVREMPKREGPLMVPIVDLPGGDVESRLFAQRRVLLSAPLDASAVTQVAAQLMALDGRSAEPVELVVNSDGGPLADVLPLLDVIGLMRAPVRTVCVGRARGTAAALLACGTGGREAAPHALISLRTSHDERVDGSPDQLRRRLEELELVRERVVAALVSATGREGAVLRAELDDGPTLDAERAKELGLVDGVGVP